LLEQQLGTDLGRVKKERGTWTNEGKRQGRKVRGRKEDWKGAGALMI